MDRKFGYSVLIATDRARVISKTLSRSIFLEQLNISCRCVSTFTQANHLLFGNKPLHFCLVIIDSRMKNHHGLHLWERLLTHPVANKMLLVTDDVVVDEGVSPLKYVVMSVHDFSSPNLDKTIVGHIIEELKENDDMVSDGVSDLQLQQQLEKFEFRYRLMLDSAGEGIIGLDNRGNITFANPKAGELLGLPFAVLVGRSFADFALDPPLVNGFKGNIDQVVTNHKPDGSRVGRSMITRTDGSFLYTEYTQSFVDKPGEETTSIIVIEDISHRIRQEAKLNKLAHTDSLTGLHNRHYFDKSLRRELESRRDENTPLLVAMMDLDGFKAINDNYGHGMGDRLLKEVSTRLNKAVRRGDLVARYGGDEFAILMKYCDIDHGKKVVQKIVEHMQTPVDFGENIFKVTCSVGLTEVFREDSFMKVMHRVDSAMYQVKNSDKNGFFFIEGNSADEVMGRMPSSSQHREATK